VNNDSISVQHSPDMILILQPDQTTGYSISVPVYRVPIGYKAYIDWDDGVID